MGQPLALVIACASWHQVYLDQLTLKHRETHGGVISTVATDALVLKLHAITTHSADHLFIIRASFAPKYSIYGKEYILSSFENNLGV